MSKLKVIILLTLFGVITLPTVFAYKSPGKPTGLVNDFAKILTTDQKEGLENSLSSFKNSTQIEIAVVTIPSLGGDTIEGFAESLFQEWGIGQKDKDNGLLILVAPNDHEVRIEVGYGLEGTITDLQSGNIIRKVLVPAFGKGDYYTGISGAVDAVVAIINNSPEASQYSGDNSKEFLSTKQDYESFIYFVFVIVGILGALFSYTKSWWLGGVVGAGAGVIVGIIWGFVYTGIIAIVLLAIVGLIIDYFASNNGPGKRGGFWFGPGGFGGGGGGFGGFGGGMSGGGGASGRW